MLAFPALVGLDQAQQALLLLAVEPRLRGVVLAARAGTGKSSLARGVRDLMREQPFVEIPSSTDLDNLLGGLDLEVTLATGRLATRQGLLAQADGGVAYVDGLNLLSDEVANQLLAVLDSAEIHVEREGLSIEAPADFSLVASYAPDNGQPRQHLLDRIGLIVTLPERFSAETRAQIVRRNLADEADWADETAFVRGMLEAAREQLPSVTIDPEQIEQLCEAALAFGVQGHRVDLFAERAACAAAALALRDAVTDDDLRLAVQLVIVPRATQLPTEPPLPDGERDGQGEQADSPPPPQQSQAESDEEGDVAPVPDTLAPAPEQILAAIEADLPDAIVDLPFAAVRRGRSGSRGVTIGKRGRHIRSVPGNPRQQRIDVIATLRTAAPWQPLRRTDDAPSQQQLRMSDVRVKQYRSKAGALFCFVVDASGSMALHRMQQAKGAVQQLLEQAYVNRDRVALIAFRGQQAELLMPPTQSVELARHALDVLPTGGGTPLGSALLLAADVADQAKQRGIMQTVLVILTDGRANVPLKEQGDPRAEIDQIGRSIAGQALKVIVVDTQRDYLSQGEAKRLADLLDGEYAYLPAASAEQIASVAAKIL